ncbi:MAG: hypothetical protein ACRDKX_07735 [Solirubrobacterales bacterium]
MSTTSNSSGRGWVVLVAAITLAVGAPVSQGKPVADPAPGLARAFAAHDRSSDQLLERQAIVGTAVGLEAGEAVVRVLTTRPGIRRIPDSVNGVPVDADVTGRILALHHRPGHSGGPGGGGGGGDDPPGPSLSPTDVWPRPVPIGISTGNAGRCSAGTIGARVSSGSSVYALSNNHVYALQNQAALGSSVLQPGRLDTNCAVDPANVLGELAAFEPLRFDGSANTIDAAIASTSSAALGAGTPPDGYGAPSGAAVAASLGQAVQKYGRTTGLTAATVSGLDASVEIGYGANTALFVDQVIAEGRKPFLKSGDSGSLAVTDPGRDAVGLLFASDPSGKLAIANDIQRVLGRFGVTIDGG